MEKAVCWLRDPDGHRVSLTQGPSFINRAHGRFPSGREHSSRSDLSGVALVQRSKSLKIEK